MGEASDRVRQARAKIRSIAARMLARKEALEAELAALTSEQVEAEASGASGTALEELGVRVHATREALAIAENDYHGALRELEDLERLEKTSARDELRATVDSALDGTGV